MTSNTSFFTNFGSFVTTVDLRGCLHVLGRLACQQLKDVKRGTLTAYKSTLAAQTDAPPQLYTISERRYVYKKLIYYGRAIVLGKLLFIYFNGLSLLFWTRHHPSSPVDGEPKFYLLFILITVGSSISDYQLLIFLLDEGEKKYRLIIPPFIPR